MTTSDILLIILMFSGSLLCLCVANFILCAEEDFASEVSEPLQNKDTTAGAVNGAYTTQNK